jgi:hypothetical protein
MVLATTSVRAAPNPVIVCRGIVALTVMMVPVPAPAAAIVRGVVIGATCSGVMPAPAAREDWTPVTVLYIPITLAPVLPVLPVPPVPELPLAMPEPTPAPEAPELPAPVEAIPDPLPPAPEVLVPALAPAPPVPELTAPLVGDEAPVPPWEPVLPPVPEVLPVPPVPAGGVVDEHPARRPSVAREVKRYWKRALRI